MVLTSYAAVSAQLFCAFVFTYAKSRFSHDTMQSNKVKQTITLPAVFLATAYRKVPKFSDARNLCCNLLKFKQRGQILRVFCQNGANGIANSEDPDQTAPLGAV